MWNFIMKYRFAYLYICLSFFIACCNDKTLVDNKTTVDIIDYDSTGFNCRMESSYSIEGFGITNCKILMNDTIALFRGQVQNNQFIQVTLTNTVRGYIKSLLYSIYSENKSVIKKQYVNKNDYISSIESKWYIKMNFEGKRIEEDVDVSSYEASFEDPFHPQYYKIEDLVYAITKKIESDIYNFKNTQNYTPKPWIEEMFHGEYYEPYNNINSNKYQ